MNKTQIRAYLRVVGDDFLHESITDLIGILPDRAWSKGDKFKDNRTRAFSLWSYGTDFEESLDIMDQIRYIVEQFKDKIEIINSLKANFETRVYITVVVEIFNNQVPAFVIDKEAIQFAYLIDAEFDIDTYIC